MSAPDAGEGFWRARLRGFVYAWRGIVVLVRTQGNARIHLVATAAVGVAGLIFRVSAGEWAILALAAGLVWAAEALNTAIEVLADRVTTERDERIGRAKDLAAGGVLFAAIAAAIAGVCIFLPKLWAMLF
jgi:diacylglycerol kinase (ATP)